MIGPLCAAKTHVISGVKGAVADPLKTRTPHFSQVQALPPFFKSLIKNCKGPLKDELG